MCTLIAFHHVWQNAPLVIACNRDEAYDRPASGPVWSAAAPAVLAPRDDRAGGTWMGASANGVWVGITNRHAGPERAGRRSRGLLCLDLLAELDAAAVADRIRSLRRRYNPFNLVAGDGRHLVAIEYERGSAAVRRLPAGVHVVTNRALDEIGDEPKAARVFDLLHASGLAVEGRRAPDDLELRLHAILGDHGEAGDDAVCRHGDLYGTRSAAVWRIGGSEIGLAYADGPPCVNPLRPVPARAP